MNGGHARSRVWVAFGVFVLVGGTIGVFTDSAAAATPSESRSSLLMGELSGRVTLSSDPTEPKGSGSNNGILVGPNVRVNVPQAAFPAGLLGRSETTIAASTNGRNLVAGWNDAQGFCGPPFGVACTPQSPSGLSGFGFSTDGGATWTDGGAPDPALGFASVGVPVFTRGDPWLAADADGNTFFYTNLAVDAVTGADLGVSVHRGGFSGASFAWNDVSVLAYPPEDFADKEAIATDPSDPDHAVVSLTNFQELCGRPQFGFGQIEVWRTQDGGDTWQGPFIAGPEAPDSVAACGFTGTLQQSSVPAFGPNGEVFVTWQFGPTFNAAGVPSKDADIFVARSFDGGATFDAPVKVADINSMRADPPVGYNRDRINDHPRIAVIADGDNGGRILVVFPSARRPTTAPATDQNLVSVNVFLSFSDDGGATWSTPTRVAGPVQKTGVKRFWPVVTVDEHEGSVDVVYYESLEQTVPGAPACSIGIGRGRFRIGPAHSLVNTLIVHSGDGGETFGAPVTVSSVTSDWCRAFGNIRPNFGDYVGATTVRGTTLAVWADDRETLVVSGVPRKIVDVFFARIRVDG